MDGDQVNTLRRVSKILLPAALAGLLLSPALAEENLTGTNVSLSAPGVTASQQPAGSRVLNTARSFLGIPYRWGGTTAKGGFDCSGYVQEVLRLNGFKVPRLADVQFAKSRKVSYQNLMPGDMVFFSTYLAGASHCGFYLGDGEFIHASSAGKKVIISRMDRGYYRQRFVGGGRPANWPG